MAVAANDVEGGAGDEVAISIEVDLGSALAFVGDGAVEGIRGGLSGGVDGYVEFKVDGKSEPNHIETWACLLSVCYPESYSTLNEGCSPMFAEEHGTPAQGQC